MPATNPRLLRFVRALVTGGTGRRDGDFYRIAQPGRPLRLSAATVAELMSTGVLAGDGATCRATTEALPWLKRQMLADAPYAGQHRQTVRTEEGAELNLAESPLARLARPTGEEGAFLTPAEVEAGERLRRLVERAHMQPRLTMSYSPTHSVDGGGAGKAPDIGDMAVDARKRLDAMARRLHPDCYGVAIDVCGFLKGLQQVEVERNWPRRSAKLVLRIALQQLAEQFGLGETATGVESARAHSWLGADARPTVFE